MTSGKDLHFGIQDLNKAFPLDSPLVCCTVLCTCIALFAERFSSNDVFVFGLYIIPEILKFSRKMWTPNFH